MWEDIAHFLGTDVAEARALHPAVERWERGFEEPCRLDERPQARAPAPTAAYDPKAECRQFDFSVRLRVYFDDPHSVSGVLRPDPPADGTPPPDYAMGGRIRAEASARSSACSPTSRTPTSPRPTGTPPRRVRSTDEDDLDTWDTHAVEGTFGSLRVRVANVTRDDDLVELVVTGAPDAKVRLRVDTPFEALGPVV